MLLMGQSCLGLCLMMLLQRLGIMPLRIVGLVGTIVLSITSTLKG